MLGERPEDRIAARQVPDPLVDVIVAAKLVVPGETVAAIAVRCPVQCGMNLCQHIAAERVRDDAGSELAKIGERMIQIAGGRHGSPVSHYHSRHSLADRPLPCWQLSF